MAPSLTSSANFLRPRTRDRGDERPSTRENNQDHNLIIPSRTSSLHSRITQPIPSTLNAKPQARTPKTLTHAYMVCGVGREPAQWVKAPAPAQGKIQHMKGAVGQFWLPEILGSSPRLEQDNEIARSLHSAMRACFPHDVEICTGRSQPHCVHHSFVLQQDSSHTLYGIALRVWSRADEKRAETIRDLRRRTESDFYDSADETYWIPYCLSFLSRYPLYNLLGDYLRGMWIHWNKATNLFHAEEVSRILSFPAPRLNDLVRIDMKDYALCYQFPSSPTGFQNFAMWPLFSCLSIPNILRKPFDISFEFTSEWSGLYVPVVHARHAQELVQEPGPYILGITAECRSLFTAPTDALVVDLDRNFVLTSSPPTALTAGQRTKMVNRITQALNGDVTPSGVPQHLRSAYGGGKLIPAGQIIVMRGEVESIQDPEWWNQDATMAVMDHVCEKMGRNSGIKAVFGGAQKKTSHDKGFHETSERDSFAEQLTKETQDLKVKIETHKRENRRLTGLIDQQKDDAARLNTRLAGTEKQRDDALEALVLQQEIAEELERERKRNKKELAELQRTNSTLLRQRDEAQRVVLHLRSLIGGQSHHLEHLVRTIQKSPDMTEYLDAEFDQEDADNMGDMVEESKTEGKRSASRGPSERGSSRASSRTPSRSQVFNRSVDDMTPEMEARLVGSVRNSKRYSAISIADVADRHLRDKTDAIAHIIRNISDQCAAAAVEGLMMAHDADAEAEELAMREKQRRHRESNLSTMTSDGEQSGEDSMLHPSGRSSSVPPTPDLSHRSSTAMSIASSVTTPERHSQQYHVRDDLPTKIIEDSDEDLGGRSDTGSMRHSLNGKPALLHRPAGARISALGGH
ncbi:hypothetical protein EYC84_009496 [Monilinia fructicola]|uniref:UDENN domain-containing protein n=1 Tax=Monilinia fructicola TaxID=38448 RepID=A0A5M9JEP8_MONFR|nr:hypothetical protein EYC84_009496 [Monilinia fructicola]